LVFPLLALSMSLAMAATAQAQQRSYNSGTSVSGTLRINLGGSPRWTSINGSRVEEIAEGQRPDYDMFRFNGGYYAYNNERWYTSRTDRGDSILIDDANVPSELIGVPRDHWRNYPSRWNDSNNRPDYSNQAPMRTSTSLQINFGNNPRWSTIRGTRIQEIRGRERPDYDMFRYGRVYYVYSNDQWYSSNRGRGNFIAIDDHDVPWELSRIPRDRWHSYPSAWMDRQRDPRNHRGNGRYR
jgi:hypothetical protein